MQSKVLGTRPVIGFVRALSSREAELQYFDAGPQLLVHV
jgi:hypothetical protein